MQHAKFINNFNMIIKRQAYKKKTLTNKEIYKYNMIDLFETNLIFPIQLIREFSHKTNKK